MRILIKAIFRTIKLRTDRIGYPIVVLTANKNNVEFKVNRKDINFNKPLAVVFNKRRQ